MQYIIPHSSYRNHLYLAYWGLHPGAHREQVLECGLDSGVQWGGWMTGSPQKTLALKCSYFLPAVWQLRSQSDCFQAEKCGTVSPNEIIAWGKDFFEAGWNVITQVGLLPGQWCLKHIQLLWKVPQDLLMTAKEWALDFFFFFFLSISSKRHDNKMRKKKLSKKELIFAKCWNM